MSNSIIIIGAGVAGLSTAIYARQNGYDTTLFEAHSLPGGFCTSWKRKGYTFDGCIHDLGGGAPSSPLHYLWQELDVLRDHSVVHCDIYAKYVCDQGELLAYADINRMQAYLYELAPQDRPAINAYIQGIRDFFPVDLFTLQEGKPGSLLSALPHLPKIVYWSRINMAQFAQRFNNPLLRRAFPHLQYDFESIPMSVHLNFAARNHLKTMGFPQGGSLAFAQRLAQYYQKLGGEIYYQARVNQILVKDNTAVGVELNDGRRFYADRVVSAGDGYSTIYQLLDGRYTRADIDHYYKNAPDKCPMNLQLSLGVNHDLSLEPRAAYLELNSPLHIAGEDLSILDIETFGYDPSLAPQGKGVIKVLINSSYAYWKNLKNDPAAYQAEKEQITRQLIEALEKPYPGISSQVESSDLATPLTNERYTGSLHGSQAWFPTRNLFWNMLRGGISPRL
ncbi:MAG: NAD(P)/FAD-dependent oxidoreductase, partial [Anaerolineae bacterium]|nr:NAD(P)/FAD-dependent oxidoreductase [Anaerolineae bacterium]